MPDDPWTDIMATEAAARERVHIEAGNHRDAFSNDYELVGLMGELQFAREFQQPLDLSRQAGGDPGHDFALPVRFTVNVKTARRPVYLIHEQGKVVADIYVLAGFDDEPARAYLLGWQLGQVLAQAPVRDFGYGKLSHYIPAEQLRPMQQLRARMMRLC